MATERLIGGQAGVSTLRRRVLIIGLSATAYIWTSLLCAQSVPTLLENSRAPFGLTWGMKSDALREFDDFSGIPRSMVDQDGSSVVRYFHLKRVPPDTNMVDLKFGHNNRLYEIEAQSENGDAKVILARYTKLSQILSELYGDGSEKVAPKKWFGSYASDTVVRNTVYLKSGVQVTLFLVTGSNENILYWFLRYQNIAEAAEFKAYDKQKQKDTM